MQRVSTNAKYNERQDGPIEIIGGAFDGMRVNRCYCRKPMLGRNRPVGLIRERKGLRLCHLDCLEYRREIDD